MRESQNGGSAVVEVQRGADRGGGATGAGSGGDAAAPGSGGCAAIASSGGGAACAGSGGCAAGSRQWWKCSEVQAVMEVQRV